MHFRLSLADHFFPTEERQFGQIRSESNEDCLQRPSSGRNPTGKVILAKCAIELLGTQMFIAPKVGEVGYIRSDESTCLDVSSSVEYSPVFFIACNPLGRQRWLIEAHTQRIVHFNSKLCITLDRRAIFLQLRKCRVEYKKQQWKFENRIWNKPLAELESQT